MQEFYTVVCIEGLYHLLGVRHTVAVVNLSTEPCLVIHAKLLLLLL